MEHLPVIPPEQSPEKKSRRGSNRDVARLVGLVAVAGAVAAFVVQNSQNVSVHFWFFSRHEPLIFVVLGCIIIGGLLGYVAGRRRGARKVRRVLLRKPDSL
ncbi:MAG: LapA family protein [Acidimicrobiales bacterium]